MNIAKYEGMAHYLTPNQLALYLLTTGELYRVTLFVEGSPATFTTRMRRLAKPFLLHIRNNGDGSFHAWKAKPSTARQSPEIARA